jgi:hypothetical protein
VSTWMNQARNLRVPKFAEEAVERARLAVVPRQRRAPAPRVPFAILVGLVLLGGVAGLLLFNTQMQKSSFAATALQARASELHAHEQQLRMELDTLRDPQGLAVWAKSHGMRPPDSPAFLELSTGRILGDAKPSTSVDDFRVTAPDASKPASINPPPLVLPREVITVKPGRDGAAHRATDDRAGRNRNDRD